jgi:carboxymethylenebutenolidase
MRSRRISRVPAVTAHVGGVTDDMFGFDREMSETVLRFAELGYDAIFPDLLWREAPGAAPADASATARANGGAPDEWLIEDVAAATDHLRSLPTSNGRLGVIGYGAGGLQALLAGCNVALDAAADCYGEYVVGARPEGMLPFQVTTSSTSCRGCARRSWGCSGTSTTIPAPSRSPSSTRSSTRRTSLMSSIVTPRWPRVLRRRRPVVPCCCRR